MLADYQEVLVTLLADRRARDRFATDPAALLSRYRLDEEEKAALSAIDPGALASAAESYVAKRWDELRRAAPCTLRIAPSLERRYRRWLAEHPAPAEDGVLSPGLAEALRALEPMARQLAEDEGEAAYAPDLLRFEVMSRASRADGEPRVLRCRFRADRLASDLAGDGPIPMDPPIAPIEYRFGRGGS